jgi:serpin B
MHSLFKGVFLFIGLVALASCVPAPNPKCQRDTVEEARKTERALADFAVNLYKNITAQQRQEDKNQVLSPVSVALALALLENGANGETRKQLQIQLTENGATDEVLSVYRALEKNLEIRDQKTRLQIANAIFHDKQAQLKQEYTQSSQDCLEAKVQEQDFKQQLEQARQQINKYIADRTENKITELFKKNVLNTNTQVVLANAIYMKAAWQRAFKKQDTKQGKFYRQGQQQDPQDVQFMRADGQYRHSQDDKLQVVELKYEKNQLSMYVLLPKQRDGIKELEQRLTGEQLRSIISRLQTRQVQIQLPKFSIRSPQDLKQPLSKMGLQNLFTTQADLSRLSEEKIQISQAIHEAYIRIDEDGTEAAAATGIAGLNAAVPSREDPTPFVADHPFLYTIVHNPTGAVVFIGRVNEVQADE